MKTKLLILFGVFCIAKTSCEIYAAKQNEAFNSEMRKVILKSNSSTINDGDVLIILSHFK